MPALFAYLIAVGLLLGGGYGALNWLAAPEPAKVVAKAKPKSPPRYEASSQAPSSETSSLTVSDSVQTASGSNVQPLSALSSSSAAEEQGAQATISSPANNQQILAHAEVASGEARRHIEGPPAEARREVRQPVPAVSPPGNAQTVARTAPAAVAKPVKRSPVRQASSHSEKSSERRALALMTLRTIEFPDGRRVTRLIPYRGGERTLAFEADD
jgi:hypothetical protein